jgi:hypothetical protein
LHYPRPAEVGEAVELGSESKLAELGPGLLAAAEEEPAAARLSPKDAQLALKPAFCTLQRLGALGHQVGGGFGVLVSRSVASSSNTRGGSRVR